MKIISRIKIFIASLLGYSLERIVNSTETIVPDDGLLRRILIEPNFIKPDNKITSFAFKPRRIDKDSLSVDLERLTTHRDAIQNRKKFRLSRLRASIPLSIGLACIHSPTTEDPAHSLIQGNFTNSVCKKLATAAELLSI